MSSRGIWSCEGDKPPPLSLSMLQVTSQSDTVWKSGSAIVCVII